MITNHEVERQLKAIGFRLGWWGRAEIKELEQVIEPGETIMYCVNGHYENGFALLCVTDHRVLLIDKKPLYLTLEDINYDMISEIDFDKKIQIRYLHVIYSRSEICRFINRFAAYPYYTIIYNCYLIEIIKWTIIYYPH